MKSLLRLNCTPLARSVPLFNITKQILGYDRGTIDDLNAEWPSFEAKECIRLLEPFYILFTLEFENEMLIFCFCVSIC